MKITNRTTLGILACTALVAASCGGSDDGGGSNASSSGSTDTMTEDTMTDDTATGDSATGDSTGSSDGDAGSSATPTLVNIDDCANPEAATEMIEGNIKIGWTAPLSGPLADAVGSVIDGMQARVDAANADGGIDGHEIEMLRKDDAFDPERAKANVAELIESDGVHILDTFGSGQLAAVADDQNIQCTPLLFANASDPALRVIAEYPWTTQYLPSSDVEFGIIAKLIQERYPDGAKVAIAENQTASGVAMVESFKAAAEGTNIEIVGEADSTDPDAAATTLSQSGATVLVDAGVAADCPAMTAAVSKAGWTPELFIQPSNCADGTTMYAPLGDAANGQIVLKWLKEAGNPSYEGDAGLAEFAAGMEAAGIAEPNSFHLSGWVNGDMMVDVLNNAAASGVGLSRAGIMEAARTQSFAPALFLDGISWEMTPESALGMTSLQPMKWDAAAGYFVADGDVISVDG